MVHGYPFNCHPQHEYSPLAFDNSRYRHNVSTPSAHRPPPERTRTVLISSSCGYDQDNSHKVTNNDLLFVLSSSHAARHSRHSSSNSLPKPKHLFIPHSPRLASPCHATPRLPDVPPTTLDLPEMYGRLYSCRLQNRGLKYSGACMDFDM